MKSASDMPLIALVPSDPLGPPVILILLSEVEEEQRLSRNGDRGACVHRICPTFQVLDYIPLVLRRWSSQDLV